MKWILRNKTEDEKNEQGTNMMDKEASDLAVEKQEAGALDEYAGGHMVKKSDLAVEKQEAGASGEYAEDHTVEASGMPTEEQAAESADQNLKSEKSGKEVEKAQAENPELKPEPEKSAWNKKAIGLILVSVIVVLALIAGMVFMVKYRDKKEQTTAIKETQTTKERIYDFGGMDGSIPLSRSGKNVIIIMLDRAIGAYVPYVFNELPELLDSYQGFTYYPNTVSYGHHTNYAVPPLYGGYEYTPAEMNKRDQELLKDKHNEALKVLPVLFSQNNYWVTVCDPPYANYSELPDVSIYDNYKNINAFNLIDYPDNYNVVAYDPTGNPWLFDNDFAALTSLPDNTIVMDNSRNTMAFIQNDATHYPKLLKIPEYVPAKEGENVSVSLPMNYEIDGKAMHMYDEYQIAHYHVNVACLKALAKWFDYLKEQGVYDNTKIIICADHGFSLYQFDDLWMSDGRDVEFMNPLLLVKDFNATGDLVTDNTFMTNADVPTLAVENTIENPTNPFTGKPINSKAKTESNPLVTTSANFYITNNNGTVFDTSDGQWWSVHDDIRVESNWRLEG